MPVLTHSNCTGAPVLATRQRDHVAGAEGFTFVCVLYVCVCVCVCVECMCYLASQPK